MEEVGKEELHLIFQILYKDKSRTPYGISMMLWIYGRWFNKGDWDNKNLRKNTSCIQHNFHRFDSNATNPTSFEFFWPVSLSNYIYKILSKIISKRLKEILSKNISGEEFGFMEGRQIHETIGVVQEGLHSIKVKKYNLNCHQIRFIKGIHLIGWVGPS